MESKAVKQEPKAPDPGSNILMGSTVSRFRASKPSKENTNSVMTNLAVHDSLYNHEAQASTRRNSASELNTWRVGSVPRSGFSFVELHKDRPRALLEGDNLPSTQDSAVAFGAPSEPHREALYQVMKKEIHPQQSLDTAAHVNTYMDESLYEDPEPHAVLPARQDTMIRFDSDQDLGLDSLRSPSPPSPWVRDRRREEDLADHGTSKPGNGKDHKAQSKYKAAKSASATRIRQPKWKQSTMDQLSSKISHLYYANRSEVQTSVLSQSRCNNNLTY